MMQSDQHIKRIFNNTGYSYISFLFWNAGVLLCNIIAARFLTPEYFGKFFLISTFIMLMSALFTGDNATVKLISENTSNLSHVSVVFKGAMFYQLVFAALAGLLLLILSKANVSISLKEITEFIGPVSLILIPYLFIIMFTTFWTGLQKMEWVMLNNIIISGFQVAVFVCLLYLSYDLKMVLWLWGSSWLFYLLVLCPLFFWIFLKHNNLKIGILEKWWNRFPHIYYLKYGIYLKISRSAQIAIPLLFGLFIKQYVSTSDLGLYAVATRFAGVIPMAIGPLFTSLFPNFSQTFSEDGFARLHSISIILYKYVNLFVFLAAAFLVLFSQKVIVWVFGQSYISADIILAILSITAYFEGLRFVSSMVLNATKHAASVAVIEISKSIFVLVFGFVAIKLFGVLGGVILILLVSVITSLAQMVLLKALLKIDTVLISFLSLLALVAFALTIIPATRTFGIMLLIVNLLALCKGIRKEEIKLFCSLTLGRLVEKLGYI